MRITEINWEGREACSPQDYLWSLNHAVSITLYNLLRKINYGCIIGNGII